MKELNKKKLVIYQGKGGKIEFRKWATKVLKRHLINGYTMNKKRIGQNYEEFIFNK